MDISNTCKLNPKQEEYKLQLLKKWNNDKEIKCGLVHPEIQQCKREIVRIGSTFYVVDTCQVCQIQKPIYLYGRQHIDIDSLQVPSGREKYRRSCLSCRKVEGEERRKKDDEIIRLMIHVNNGDLTIEWVKQQLEKQNHCCHITNLPITLERGHYNTASVQNNGEGHLHYQQNCVLMMTCLQVQEHAIPNLKDAWNTILSMMKKENESSSDTTTFLQQLDIKFSNTTKQNGVTAPTHVYEDETIGRCNSIIQGKNRTKKSVNIGKICGRVCVKYETVCLLHLTKEKQLELNQNPELKKQLQQNGKQKINPEYSSQCMNLHLPRILRDQVERYYASDQRSKSRKDKSSIVKLKSSDIVKKLHEQKGRCYLSGVPFSFNRFDPNYWSLERVDNTKHHTNENTVLICRIMNGRTQLTKEIIQQIYNEYHSLD